MPPVPARLEERASPADIAAYVPAALRMVSVGLFVYGLIFARSSLSANVGLTGTGLCILSGIGLKASLGIAGRRRSRQSPRAVRITSTAGSHSS